MEKDKEIPKGQERSETAKREEEVLAFWDKEQIFEKTLEKKAPKGEFVFYDGPPFATGLPHAGSLLSSTIKDVIPRYKTMRGFYVRRRWGWDTHGLPIENLVEKKLGLKNKKDILDIGIDTFNEAARSLVLDYVSDWKEYIHRLGRWVDFDNSYKTMDNSYIESVWWALKQIHQKGNLYEGRKVLMYCPHCETPLAKAEIAADNTYKDITEEAVTVKFKLKSGQKIGNWTTTDQTYILAWTTTPWTLPGNVGLAVGEDIEYVEVNSGGEILLLAKERASLVEGSFGNIWKGKEFVGLQYEPLYKIEKVEAHKGKKWEVLQADFVSTGEGTGIVHTAVIYGEDDFNLGLKEGLPMVQLLNSNGTFNNDAPEFVRGQYIKKAESLIKDDLTSRGLLFKKENNTHSYPHCWRCGTALIYNAVPSWFINIQKLKQRIINENEKVNWVPDHLKHGRFKHILEGAPDWTISRSRFWASPLPIWKNKKGEPVVVGSLEELKKLTKRGGNHYIVIRHGEAEQNVKGICSSDVNDNYKLTDKGIDQIKESAESFKVKPTVIYTSPFFRTRQSAEIIAEVAGISKDSIKVDDRIREINFGDYNQKPYEDFLAYERENMKTYDTPISGGESYQDAKNRFAEFIYDIDSKHQGETIAVVSHGIAAETLVAVLEGADSARSKKLIDEVDVALGSVFEFDFTPLPHNKNYELDLHRPYIDNLELVDEDGEKLERIPEVVDCWVESGVMPFAEYHYPFENVEEFEKRAPGDFIAEYIAQTRTWFYYMHVLGVQLFDRLAFKNVVTTGTILAADGSKMSKSKGNYTDPLVNINKYGADAFRFYLMGSVVMQAEDFSFKDEELRDVHNRVVNMLRNILAFYTLYKDEASEPQRDSHHVLDQWIIALLDELISLSTTSFDQYDTVRPSRLIKEFIDDFSTWYVRRSRDRMRGEDVEDKKRALATFRYVLIELSKIIAPIMPFVADEIYESVRDEKDEISVHLSSWPEISNGSIIQSIKGAFGMSPKTSEIITLMDEVRRVCSVALEARQKASIKVRQPLQKLTVRNKSLARREEFVSLIKDEINVKEVVFDSSLSEEVILDINISEDLRGEGFVRELIRGIQDIRKEMQLFPSDEVSLRLKLSAGKEKLVKMFEMEIMRTTKSRTLEIKEDNVGKHITVDGEEVEVGIQKI